ncbi:MAG: tail fiber domain-containing protein [Bacteroidales bacterium]
MNNAGGIRNVFIGHGAGKSNSTGANNQCIGTGAGVNLSNGAANIMIGTSSGSKISTGDFNIVMGNYAGQGMGSNDSYNIILGNFAGWYAPIGDRKLFIDCDAVTNPLIYGNFAADVIRIYGNLEYTGTLTHVSDVNLKTNFSRLDNVLGKISSINSYYFDWNAVAKEELSLGDEKQLGLIAQEVEIEFPELVSLNDKGYKTINYVNLTPILLQATKEQQQIIEDQESRISTMEAELAELRAVVMSLTER